MTDADKQHLREEKHEFVLARIHETLAEARIWRAQYDLWRAGPSEP